MTVLGAQGRLVRPLTLVAFGGNALLGPEDMGKVSEQLARARRMARWLVELTAAGHDLLVVHGNGPQVGQVLLQMEEGATKVPPATLDVAVAQTEGAIGYMLELTLRNELSAAGLEREVAGVLSLVVVDGDDPGFEEPTKPIGPFYSRWRATYLEREQGWRMVEDSGRGWRKVVASPRPLEVLSVAGVRQLLAEGAIVIAGGGGGIPVKRTAEGLEGVEAVIDKDYTAALLGRELSADLLVSVTGVPQVYRRFGQEDQEGLPELTVAEARKMVAAGEFPAGSMRPKIQAALEFVEGSGHPALVTDIDHLAEAVAGRAGTRIVARR